MKIISEIDKRLADVEVVLRYPIETAQVNRIKAALLNLEKRVVGKDETGRTIIPVQNILYFEAVNRKVFIYTEHAMYEAEKKLYEILELLEGSTFFQASKQIVVNLNRVRSISQEIGSRLLLTMDNDEKIVVSRQYAPEIRKELEIK